MPNRNPNKIYNARKFVSSNDKMPVGASLLGRKSKACQINAHGACLGNARQFRKCKCQCHLEELEAQ